MDIYFIVCIYPNHWIRTSGLGTNQGITMDQMLKTNVIALIVFGIYTSSYLTIVIQNALCGSFYKQFYIASAIVYAIIGLPLWSCNIDFIAAHPEWYELSVDRASLFLIIGVSLFGMSAAGITAFVYDRPEEMEKYPVRFEAVSIKEQNK